MPVYVPLRKVNRDSRFSATACLWEQEQFFRRQLTVQPGGTLVMVEGLGFLRQYSDVMFCAFFEINCRQSDMPHGTILKAWSES